MSSNGSLDRPLLGRVALITGAARGQGRSHAVTLAKAGANVVIADIADQIPTVAYAMSTESDLTMTEKLVAEHGVRCHSVIADMRDPAAVTAMVESVIEVFGRVDILCANAGISPLYTLQETTRAIWDDTIGTNLSGVFHAIRAVAPSMIENAFGRIVATGSIASRSALTNLSAYTASKWGVLGLVKAAAAELGPHGITVNAVCPGFIDTPMNNHDVYNRLFRPDLEHPARETSEEVVRVGTPMNLGCLPPQAISDAVLFLVTDAGQYISGTGLDVNAGRSVAWSA
ncbi:mycofactocin-coupled SDR family oxidoreductase [Rhodococcus sp. T2V]|uniref:mycofactocin-coupled SDR family oxidoreductase n=1 Tax=Rhodococcus sp. T2V TaxID=3034164 RepID=UPI0023E1E990|nr:mycofactocin-coupled SDR family oxidoreductase [Rhodococcus sp. T2V]MDF3306434.1 mycofactocin-coupled SDR family oxidoreductase [Rhodococcus sp. T2V]